MQPTEIAPPLARSSFLFTRMSSLFVRAGKKSFWPMVDQGVVSVGNFLTTIYVARGLSKIEYGQFSVVLEFMFFLNNLQAALVTYPLTVKGAISDREGLKRLVSASALLTVVMGAPIVFLTLIIGGAIGKFAIGASAVIALVLWQLQETMRRGQWAQFQHRDAIIGDTISYIGQAIGMYALYRTNRLTLVAVFGVMTVTSMAAAIVQALQVGLHPIARADLKQLARDFWITGRWIAFTNVSTIATSICGSWALWIFHSGEQVADFFAIANLLKLCNPVISSVSGLITPAAAKKLASDGIRAAQRISAKYALLGSAMLGPFFLFMLITPSIAMKIAYGAHTAYLGRELAVRICTVGYMCVFVSSMVSAYLNGIEKSRYTFYGQVVNTIAQFVILLPLNIALGLMGYVWGGLIQVFIQVIVLFYFARQATREPYTPKLDPAIDPALTST